MPKVDLHSRTPNSLGLFQYRINNLPAISLRDIRQNCSKDKAKVVRLRNTRLKKRNNSSSLRQEQII